MKVEKEPVNWIDAFELLKDLIQNSQRKKKIIFIDELSWMDTQKGGLYNRLTCQIYLKPFKLYECEEYLKSRNINLNRYDILELYMAIGGIPFYWTYVEKGLSVAQNIDKMFFADDAPLRDEFKYLYASLFKNPQNYIDVVTVLAKKKVGFTRDEISKETGISNSGNLTKILDELISCDFIRKYSVFGKKVRDALYQLTDFYTLFYFQFLRKRPAEENFWSLQTDTSVRNTWCGLAFERVCLNHIAEIKTKLGISGVLTEVHSWSCKEDKSKGLKRAQIDLVIVRNDRIINLCEMKYSISEYNFTQKDDESLRNKIVSLKTVSKTKYSIHPVLVTTYGLSEGKYSGIIQRVVNSEDLFVNI